MNPAMLSQPIISCAQFAARPAGEWVVLDCRHDPHDAQSGWRAFQHSRVPGAQFAHATQDLSGADKTLGRYPLPRPEDFVHKLAHWGITNTTSVLIYDHSGSTYAARLWWMLRWIGHRRAVVLDGGWRQWRLGDYPLEYSLPTREAGRPPTKRFEPQINDSARVDLDDVLANLHSRNRCLIDARPASRYLGIEEPWDAVAGHIPGALNRPYQTNLDAANCFLSAAQLRAAFSQLIGDLPPGQVVHQCGAGITACNNLLAMEIAGMSGSKLYPGSWSEWCADSQRPMVRASWSVQTPSLAPPTMRYEAHRRH